MKLIIIAFLATIVISLVTTYKAEINHKISLKMAINPQMQQIFISQSSSDSKLSVSVKDFGAVGNGVSDDTQAIQKAIDRVYQSGGGIVYFPSGTYKISIDNSKLYAITIRSNVTLQGESSDKAIVKLADKQPSYTSIMAGEKPDLDISNFNIYNLGIDGNSSNNPIIPDSDFNRKKLIMRHAVRIYVGSQINIRGCKFSNHNSINVIAIIQDEIPITNVSIKDNIFENIGGGNIDYDHSTIYTDGANIEISNNKFSSLNGGGTNGARTAIEIHGDLHVVKNNEITGFANGINVTGFAEKSNSQVVANNIINNAYWGITIWSYFEDGNKINPALYDCLIENNTINLNIKNWRKLWGDAPSKGIFLETNSDAPIKKMYIKSNTISFTNFADSGRSTDRNAGGIMLLRNAAPNVVSEDIRIIDNQITNSLASGIFIDMPINEGEISRNTITNTGRSNGDFSDYYKTAIIVKGVLKNFKVNENEIVDDQDKATTKTGIIYANTCTGNCEKSDNKLKIKGRKQIPILRQE